MFGTKIRSWMEAHIVRPRKKQHRKDAASKKRVEIEVTKEITEPSRTLIPVIHNSNTLTGSNKTVVTTEQMHSQYQNQHNSNNLSSPESAYSTGYSTDGTSPGTTFPASTLAPEYYINIRTGTRYFHSSSSDVPLRLSLPSTGCPTQQKFVPTAVVASNGEIAATTCVASPALTSPRQRNRIRTNPWVTTNTSVCNCSPLHVAVARQSILNQTQTPVSSRSTVLASTASPIRRKWPCADKKQRCMKCGACSRFEAFSSSSSSSLSVSSVHRAINNATIVGIRNIPAASLSVASDDEDDRTLNEMMGKYDESYIYEKETDILSDSDPTDCDEEYDDTDAEAGREGGDERDPLTDEDDFDFIDNGSLELSVADDKNNFVNMGHCTYHNFIDEQSVRRRRCAGDSHTPTSSRRRRPSERRSRHTSSKKRRERGQLPGLSALPALVPVRAHIFNCADGSRSAGATPVSVRRRRAATSALVDSVSYLSRSVDKPRRNSISFARNSHTNTNGTDNKLIEFDKEADKKYRELIIEAEHILRAMRTSSPPVVGSPARRSNAGPANKRVELLRNEECGGGNINNSTSSVSIDPYSPKRKHNFPSNNSNAPLPVSKLASAPRWPPRPDVQQHCPQSEPVKRKVYAHANSAVIPKTDVVHNANSTAANPVFHRQKLFHTITSLKKNLENQSETLRHAYHGSNTSQRL